MSEGLEQGRGRASGDRVAAWPQGLLLAAQAMLPTMGAMLLVPVVPLLIAEFGHTPNAQYLIPAILTMPALCIALLSPVAGWLGDRMGRRNLLIGALCFYGLAGMSPLLLHGIWAVISSRVVLGICEALIITLSATLIGDYFVGKPRDRWLAMISTIASLSAVVFLAVAGAVGAAFGWRWVTAVYGLSILFVPAMLLLSWEPKRGPVPARAPEGPVEAFPWNHMVVTGLTSLFGGTLFYSLVIQQGIALSSLGVQDPARLGLLTAVASLATPVGALAFWRVSHWRASLLLAIEFAIVGSACVVIGFVQTDIQFAMAAAMGLFGCGLLLPTLISWTMRSLPFSGRARGTGIFQSMLMLGQFVSGVLLALLTTSISGSILKSFAVIGAAALLAALIAAATLRTRWPAEGPVATES